MANEQKPVSKQEAQMLKIEQDTKKAKRKWVLIMLLIMAAFIGVSVGVSVIFGLKVAPYAFIFAIVTVAITGKLCMAQLGKVLEKQRNEREKLDTGGDFARFKL